jgi:uncharacterized membrane protein
MKVLSLFALVMTVISAFFLYLASKPVAGAIQFVGDNRTEQDIKASERLRKLELIVGFALLVLSAAAQAVVIYSACNQ